MKMNVTILTLTALISISTNISAFERESLIEGSNSSLNGFVSFTGKNTDINGTVEQMAGVKAAWLIDHYAYVGLAGYGTESDLKNTEFQMGYGGFIAGYTFSPEKLLHYNLEILVGAGGLTKNNADKSDAFVVIEPAVNVGVSLTEYVNLSFGLSYRLVKETDKNNISDSDFSGWSANTSFSFGYF